MASPSPSATTEEICALCASLLSGCGVAPGSAAAQRALADVARAHRAPAGAVYSLPTAALSKVMRALKARAVGEAGRADVDEAFVKLVAKVRGGAHLRRSRHIRCRRRSPTPQRPLVVLQCVACALTPARPPCCTPSHPYPRRTTAA